MPLDSTPLVQPPIPIGVAPLAKLAFDGADLEPIWHHALARLARNPDDVATVMDLATIAQLCGHRAEGLALQARALSRERLYRRPEAGIGRRELRLLAFMAPGDFMANTPLEFLLEGTEVRLDMLYVAPGSPLDPIPEHDLAFVAVGESDANQPLLDDLAARLAFWPRPVLNRPERITRLSRDAAAMLLADVPGIAMPPTVRLDRATIEAAIDGKTPLAEWLPGGAFPIIARPIASHAGKGLERIDSLMALDFYLLCQPGNEFYLAPFVDYRSKDGLYRKARIALIEGKPFACHMAISSSWMVHYLNAGMAESAEKRDEEACFMAGFDEGFAVRHATALAEIVKRTGLDYVALDCAETQDGRLLIFEADVAMIVHAMDPPELYPYKAPQMRKVFAAFRAMLRGRVA